MGVRWWWLVVGACGWWLVVVVGVRWWWLVLVHGDAGWWFGGLVLRGDWLVVAGW